MEWIDHHNPYEGYDGSDVEEEDTNKVVHEDNTTVADYAMEEYNKQSSIDSLFGSEDNDN